MIKNLPFVIGKNASLTLLKAQKNSPTILFGAGVIGVIGTVVLASRATLKLSEIVDETAATLEQIENLENDKYSAEDKIKDKAITYTQAGLKITKLYAPAIAVGVISISCLAGSHNILTRRNIALSAAYAGVEKSLREYRQRVIDQVGVEAESLIWQPMEEVDAIDENGKKVKTKLPVAVGGSPYKMLFDEANPNWNKEAHYNQLFINCQQQYANDKLRMQGFLFLNDVLDMLGMPRTKAGQIVGWVWQSEKGDSYVDFGVFKNGYDGLRFVQGDERSVWLDFNVDGNVLDILG